MGLKYVGTHALDLPGGRVLAPGDAIPEEPLDEDNKEEYDLLLESLTQDGLIVNDDEAVVEEADQKVKRSARPHKTEGKEEE